MIAITSRIVRRSTGSRDSATGRSASGMSFGDSRRFSP